MHYTFDKAILTQGQHRLPIENVTVEVVDGEVIDAKVRNSMLNGRHTVKCVFDNECLRNQSKIEKSSIWTLILRHDSQCSRINVFILDLLGIGEGQSKHWRRYIWMGVGIQKPLSDNIGLLPGDGEITLEELLIQIGDCGPVAKRSFNAEGGLAECSKLTIDEAIIRGELEALLKSRPGRVARTSWTNMHDLARSILGRYLPANRGDGETVRGLRNEREKLAWFKMSCFRVTNYGPLAHTIWG